MHDITRPTPTVFVSRLSQAAMIAPSTRTNVESLMLVTGFSPSYRYKTMIVDSATHLLMMTNLQRISLREFGELLTRRDLDS